MQARKALLKRLAAVSGWDSTSRASFQGESWLESRNTIYRFRDGVCVDVASRDPEKSARARALVGMRLVGWLAGPASLFTADWVVGACAVLWRPASPREGASDEALAMTSASTHFTRGRSSGHLQALHDHVPPVDSQTFRRDDRTKRASSPRPKLPSSSYGSAPSR